MNAAMEVSHGTSMRHYALLQGARAAFAEDTLEDRMDMIMQIINAHNSGRLHINKAVLMVMVIDWDMGEHLLKMHVPGFASLDIFFKATRSECFDSPVKRSENLNIKKSFMKNGSEKCGKKSRSRQKPITGIWDNLTPQQKIDTDRLLASLTRISLAVRARRQQRYDLTPPKDQELS